LALFCIYAENNKYSNNLFVRWFKIFFNT